MAVFVDLFHFLLFFVTFLLLVTLVNYFFTIEGSLFVTFVTFFTACNFHELLFIVERGQGNCFIIFIISDVISTIYLINHSTLIVSLLLLFKGAR
jgi:hypothetical protein